MNPRAPGRGSKRVVCVWGGNQAQVSRGGGDRGRVGVWVFSSHWVCCVAVVYVHTSYCMYTRFSWRSCGFDDELLFSNLCETKNIYGGGERPVQQACGCPGMT